MDFRYKHVVKDNQIDLILYVAAADEKPDLKLFKAIQKARLGSKDEKIKSKINFLAYYCSKVWFLLNGLLDMPVLLAVTKMDLLSEAEQNDFAKNVSYFHPESYALYDDDEFSYDVSIYHGFVNYT